MNYQPKKYIVSLTTIPSKFDNIHYSLKSLLNQNILIDKIILHIPKIYNFRFNNQSIPQEKIDKFRETYSKYDVYINLMDNDFGPGTKLLGLFYTDLIKFDNSLDDKIFLIVDDDLRYKPHMIKYFDICHIKNPQIEFASYYVYKINNYDIAQACAGLFIKPSVLNNFLQYYNDIKNYDYVNYHDDVYISYYFRVKNIKIYHLKPYRNHCIYILTKISRFDALHRIQGKYSRSNLELELAKLLDTFEIDDKFNYLK